MLYIYNIYYIDHLYEHLCETPLRTRLVPRARHLLHEWCCEMGSARHEVLEIRKGVFGTVFERLRCS